MVDEWNLHVFRREFQAVRELVILSAGRQISRGVVVAENDARCFSQECFA
jgi:hypothetical protein